MGQGYFSGVRALILPEVVKTTLYDLSRGERTVNKEDINVKTMEVFHSLIACGAVYWDRRLKTFIYCEADESDSGKVMVVDLEPVELPTSFLGWKPGVNREGARALMEDFSSLSDRYHKQVSSRFGFPEALTSIVVRSKLSSEQFLRQTTPWLDQRDRGTW